MRGVGVGGDGDTGGSGASRGGEGTERGNLHPTRLLSSTGPPLSGLCPPHPLAAPHPFIPSIPILWAHILGVKGIVASTAELVAALGTVKVHATSSGQCVRELALGAVCKGQHVRLRLPLLKALKKGAAGNERLITGQTGLVGQPYQCHFPEDTLPGPGPGILGHWCVSSSGNPRSSGLGAAPPTARRKAIITWKLHPRSFLLVPPLIPSSPWLSLWHCHPPLAQIPN